MPPTVKSGRRKGLSMEEKVAVTERWFTAHPQPYTLKELQQLIPKHTPVISQSVEECVQLLAAERRIEEDRVGVHTLFWKFPPTATQRANPTPSSAGSAAGLGSPSSYQALLHRIFGCGTATTTPQQQQQQQQHNHATVSEETISRWCAATPAAQLREWRGLLEAECARALVTIAEERKRLGLEQRSSSDPDVASSDSEEEEEAVQAEMRHLRQLALQRAQLQAEHKSVSSHRALPELVELLERATAVAMAAANRWTDNYFLGEEAIMAVAGGEGAGSRRDIRLALQVPTEVHYLSEGESDVEDDAVSECRRQECDDRRHAGRSADAPAKSSDSPQERSNDDSAEAHTPVVVADGDGSGDDGHVMAAAPTPQDAAEAPPPPSTTPAVEKKALATTRRRATVKRARA